MRLILVGNKKELLSSVVPENGEIDTVVLSSKTEVECTENHTRELVIIDLDNVKEKPREVYTKLANRPTSPAIWAYYSRNDAPIRKRLLEIGFQNVFSYEDNIVAEIRRFAQNT